MYNNQKTFSKTNKNAFSQKKLMTHNKEQNNLNFRSNHQLSIVSQNYINLNKKLQYQQNNAKQSNFQLQNDQYKQQLNKMNKKYNQEKQKRIYLQQQIKFLNNRWSYFIDKQNEENKFFDQLLKQTRNNNKQLKELIKQEKPFFKFVNQDIQKISQISNQSIIRKFKTQNPVKAINLLSKVFLFGQGMKNIYSYQADFREQIMLQVGIEALSTLDNYILIGTNDSRILVYDSKRKQICHKYNLKINENGQKISSIITLREVIIFSIQNSVYQLNSAGASIVRKVSINFQNRITKLFQIDNYIIGLITKKGKLYIIDLQKQVLIKNFEENGQILSALYNNKIIPYGGTFDHLNMYDIRQPYPFTIFQPGKINHICYGQNRFIYCLKNENLMFTKQIVGGSQKHTVSEQYEEIKSIQFLNKNTIIRTYFTSNNQAVNILI